jgi:hypothetical protein
VADELIGVVDTVGSGHGDSSETLFYFSYKQNQEYSFFVPGGPIDALVAALLNLTSGSAG